MEESAFNNAAPFVPFFPIYLWMILIWGLPAIVHICFAVAVLRDCDSEKRQREGTFLVGPWIWALAVLVGGVIAAGVYWIVHYLALRPAAVAVAKPIAREMPPAEY